jgi:hypothetical protein
MNDNSKRGGASSGSRLDWLPRLGFVLGLAMLTFLAGMIVAINQTPPYRMVRDAWIAFSAMQAQQSLLASKWPAYLWMQTNRQEKGLVQYEPSSASDGLTVFTSAHEGAVQLVDMDGREVHRWTVPFRKVWPHARHVPSWLPDQFVNMQRVHVYPNGDLLAVYSTTANTPSGCGLAKFDRDSKVIWTYDGNAHHDCCVANDGTIYALNHRLRRVDDDTQLASLSNVPIVEDLITVFASDGKERKTFSVLEALVKSPYFRPILYHVDRFGDITHNNTIDVVDEKFAARHQGVSSGNLMVCLRNFELIVVLDPDSQQVVWATTGPWHHPHDPDPLPNGNILIFDNYLVQGLHHGSGVVEFDPLTRQVAWMYTGEGASRLRSDIRSCQQVLPNGNVLITESDQGRILEVTRARKVVWEYINPARGGDHGELIPIVCSGHRYGRDELPFVTELAAERVDTAKSFKLAGGKRP